MARTLFVQSNVYLAMTCPSLRPVKRAARGESCGSIFQGRPMLQQTVAPFPKKKVRQHRFSQFGKKGCMRCVRIFRMRPKLFAIRECGSCGGVHKYPLGANTLGRDTF